MGRYIVKSTPNKVLVDQIVKTIKDVDSIKERLNNAPAGAADTLQRIKYSDLKTLRNNAELIPGQFYQITDYECSTTQSNTRAMSHKFDIIVQALSESLLSENASATYHQDGGVFDGHFAQNRCHLEMEGRIIEDETGESEYEIQTDSDVFIACSYAENSEGVSVPVLYKTDIGAFPNDPDYEDICYYVGTYELDGVTYDKWNKVDYSYESENKLYILTQHVVENGKFTDALQTSCVVAANVPAWEIKYCLDNDVNRFGWADSENGHGVIYYMKDEHGNECPYDFKNIQFSRDISWQEEHSDFVESLGIEVGAVEWFYTFSWIGEDLQVNDLTLKQNMLNSQDSIYSNKIKEFKESGILALNNNIVINSYQFDEGFFHGCFANTFENDCQFNTFGNVCNVNTLSYGCSFNTFTQRCHNIYLETACRFIDLGQEGADSVRICSGIRGTQNNRLVISEPTNNCIYRPSGFIEVILEA